VYSRLTPDKPADLWCTPEGQVPGRSVSDIIREHAAALNPIAGPKDFRTPAGITAQPAAARGRTPAGVQRHPAILIVAVEKPADLAAIESSGRIVRFLPPRPFPAGAEAAKAAIQGGFYLLSLRAQLVGQTLVGLRADEIIRAVDEVVSRPDVDPVHITAYANGPSAIALLHAAAVDKRITRVVVEDSLASFRMIAAEPLHRNAPESMIPGVLQHYDIPDLIKAIAPRPVEFLNPVDAAGEHIKESYHPGSILPRLMK
jgi:hypothetical protein